MTVLPARPQSTTLPAPRFTFHVSRFTPHFSRLLLHPSSLILLLAALAVAGLALLPPAYLLLRTAASGANALDVLLRPSTLTALWQTVLLAVTVTLASAALAVPLAWLTVATDLPGRRLWAVVAALPLVLPSYVGAYLMASILGPKGLLQQTLQPLTSLERLPNIYGFPGAFLALTLLSYPYTLLSVRAALLKMDPSLVEAARSLGLSPWRAFWRVTLPHLRPSLVAGSLLVILYVLRDFGAVTIMRYTTFTRLIYVQYQSFFDRSLAATLSLVLVALTAAVLYLELRTRGRAHYSRRSAGVMRQQRPVALGHWRWPALLFVGSVALVGLILPAGGLLYWLARELAARPDWLALWQSAWHSLSLSLTTAVVALAAAVPVATLSVRRPGRFIHLLERFTYAGYALPGLVIALALVFFGATYAPALYQTLPMLLAAYVILFIPQAVGATRTSLLQIPATLEEAGRSLGHHPWRVFRRVTLPLLRPGLLAGAALVFLTCMKELPATLLLSPFGYRTLATAVWSNISEAYFAQAAVPTLLLILLSSIPLAILTLRERPGD
ncbi:MAG: iron ABC transporter permease [Chloroflexota bacterium]